MPTTQQLRSKLIDKLKELFQLNQADLDFGFYRIMHAKSEQVTRFLEDDLLAIIGDAFGKVDDHRKTQLKAEYEREVETAKEYGASDPESVPKVKEARERYKTARDTASAEGEIYDHLYRFFERYYDNGDFISRRYYTRETPGKAAPFAVPYNGEEVKLHWANADQYYIKTAEHFQNYTVDIRQAAEIRALTEANELDLEISDDTPRLVHFRIVDATEGEHGNVKASEATKRYFIIHKDEPVVLTGKSELVIQFEYRPDPEKTGQERTWRDKRNAEATEVVLVALDNLDGAGEYKRLITVPAPTKEDTKRHLLAKYINQYTARNTMDYFIHKDLGAFLRRELDFYIKNEVMHLDDIESAEVPMVETYLSKLKVLRSIAHKLIDFLAQLEDFQKRLWLKKKFVIETNYCITLDRIPEEFYPEIAANDAQREEWVRLFAIDEIKASTVTPGYTEPLTSSFLEAYEHLILDTCFFPRNFVDRLLAHVAVIDDEQCNGLLIGAENSAALSLLRHRYYNQVRAIYIDPPYNTEGNAILYKNTYKHSSWMTLMESRLLNSKTLETSPVGVHVVAIDNTEQPRLAALLNAIWPERTITHVSVIHNPGGTMGKDFSGTGEYAVFIYPEKTDAIAKENREDSPDVRDFMNTAKGSSGNYKRETGKNCFYPVYVRGQKIIGLGDICDDDFHPTRNIKRNDGVTEVYPVDNDGVERKWVLARGTATTHLQELNVKIDSKTELVRIERRKDRINYKTVWTDKKYSAKKYGTELLSHIIPATKEMSRLYPKSIHLVKDCIHAALGNVDDCIVLDYFAGSGTTAQAVMTLNREDNGVRRYILIEMGDHFDTVLKPRVQKVIYAKDWKDGKPVDPSTGISHCFKYIRLESYEDCLNNLVFAEDGTRDRTLQSNDSLREDYMLHYMLDVETHGSQSLLNIDAFADPTAYTLRVKKPGSDQYVTRNVDLIETFNYLIGLRVSHIAAPQSFTATFKRETDPELPEDTQTRLVVDGRLTQDENGPWWFRKVEGWVPADLNNPNGDRQKVLIAWRKLTGKIEEDNLMLDEWFKRNRISTRDFEFDVIYVNGSNNLPNLKQEGDNWKVRLIEEDFMRLMWDENDL